MTPRTLTLVLTTALAAALAATSARAAALNGLTDPSFEGIPGLLSDSGGVELWSSYGDNGQRWSITNAVAHTGTQSITNTGSTSADPSIFSLLYQFDTTDNPAEILGQTFTYSFWVYYDGSLAGQSPSTDSVGFQFNARDAINEVNGEADGTVLASSLPDKTWTQFTGTFTVANDPSITPGGPLDRLGAVLISPSGTWYADDMTLTNLAATPVPEPFSLSLLGLGLLGMATRRRRA